MGKYRDPMERLEDAMDYFVQDPPAFSEPDLGMGEGEALWFADQLHSQIREVTEQLVPLDAVAVVIYEIMGSMGVALRPHAKELHIPTVQKVMSVFAQVPMLLFSYELPDEDYYDFLVAAEGSLDVMEDEDYDGS